jgi:hypothetical protein
MKLTARDKSFAIVDEALDSSYFMQFWKYFNGLDFVYRSMSGWQKVWRINDGQVLSGSPYFHSQAPFNCLMDVLHQTIVALAKQQFSNIVGEEGKDWHDVVLTPYVYSAGTKISWHDDYGYTGAAIFYPHIEWNPHWGGELMIAKTPSYEELDLKNAIAEEVMTRDYISPILNAYGIGTYIAPLPNRIAFTSGEVWHQINRVDAAAGDHVRCSIVAFFLKEKNS